MLAGIFHPGSGLGNMLHRYIAIRVLALDKGYSFSVLGSGNFKGKSFMNLNMGEISDVPCSIEYPAGKLISSFSLPLWEEKTNYYNPEFNFIDDNTIIDGEFQSEQYFGHRLNEINEWLKVEPIDIPDDVCIINFRGGEYAAFPDLFLTPDYWAQAMDMMLEINPNMQFEVHTDDFILATIYFPGFKVIHDIGINWRSLRYTKYAIIANSSFAILPRLLNGGITIAPRYWARRNTNTWSTPQNYYKKFTYI